MKKLLILLILSPTLISDEIVKPDMLDHARHIKKSNACLAGGGLSKNVIQRHGWMADR